MSLSIGEPQTLLARLGFAKVLSRLGKVCRQVLASLVTMRKGYYATGDSRADGGRSPRRRHSPYAAYARSRRNGTEHAGPLNHDRTYLQARGGDKGEFAAESTATTIPHCRPNARVDL